MKKRWNKLWMTTLAMLLSCSLCCTVWATVGQGNGNAGQVGLADVRTTAGSGAVLPASAESGAGKEEVVYANLNGDGSLSAVYVVNILQPDAQGEVEDYGNYTEVRNMTTQDAIQLTGDVVSLHTDASKLYYEGKLEGAQLPWKLSIQHLLNGQELPAAELAGKSGAWEMRMQLSANPDGQSVFYQNFALQVAILLDTALCEKIEAPGATLANVGSDKQLSYVILPHQDKDIAITAQVQNFEMGSVSINGVNMALDVDVDAGAMTGQVAELQDAVGALSQGATSLAQGVQDLQEGSSDLHTGAGQVNEGVTSLADGAQELSEGTGSLYGAAKQAHQGADALATGAQSLQDGSGDLWKAARQVQIGAGTLEQGAGALDDGVATVQTGAKQLKAGIQQVTDGAAAVQTAVQELDSKSDALTGASDQIQTALQQIQSALASLEIATDKLDGLISSSASIRGGIEELSAGMQALCDGISQYDAGQVQGVAAKDGGMAATLEEYVAQQEDPELAAVLSQAAALLETNSDVLYGVDALVGDLAGEARALASGASTLKKQYAGLDDALQTLPATMGELVDQLNVLKQAVFTLNSRYADFDSGLDAYAQGVKQLAAGYDQVYSGILSVGEGTQALQGGLSDLRVGSTQLVSGASTLETGAGQLADGSGDLYSGAQALLAGATQLSEGLAQLYDGMGSMHSGTQRLLAGAQELSAGSKALYEGSGTLASGAGDAAAGAQSLAAGAQELSSATADMDTKVQEAVDEAIQDITGGDFTLVSFVSEKNTDVSAVQFVLKTPAIQLPQETPPAEEQPETQNIWQKIVGLFKGE